MPKHPRQNEKNPRRATRRKIWRRDLSGDDAAIDAYLKHNQAALNASIQKAKAEFERGEYFTLEQVMADVAAQRQRRLRKQ